MSDFDELEHAKGSVQGICSGAIGLLALLVAFIGYTGFNSKAADVAWSHDDLPHLGLALIAAVSLALVPWIATKPQQKASVGKSVERARRFFLVGSMCTVAAMAILIARNFLG